MLANSVNYNSILKSHGNSNKIPYGARVRYFDKGYIFPQTNNLWLLKKGAVKTITYDESGNTLILGYWGKGDIVGLPLSKLEHEIHCLNSVEALYIAKEKYEHFATELIDCVRKNDELLRIIRVEKLHKRLGSLLIWLANKFGSPVLQGTSIDIRLTHQELADTIGSTRVTVTRLLNQWEQENAIVRPRRFSIVIRDLRLFEKQLRLS